MSTLYAHICNTLAPSLTGEQIECYRRDGLLAVRQLLTPEQVRDACDAWAEIVRKLHGDVARGSATYQPSRDVESNYAGASISRVGGPAKLLFERGMDPLGLSASEAEVYVRNLYFYEAEHPLFQRMVADAMIMGVVRQLIDDEPILFQSMALTKPPRIGSEKPWHQDDAYFKYAPLEKIAGVWIALDDATVANGCMHVLPGWHKRGALKHVHTFDCQILPDRLAGIEPVAVELPPGGAMFFSGLLPHQTPPNRSDQRRRALQFHYRGASTRSLETQDYNRTFAEADGSPASCDAAPTFK